VVPGPWSANFILDVLQESERVRREGSGSEGEPKPRLFRGDKWPLGYFPER